MADDFAGQYGCQIEAWDTIDGEIVVRKQCILKDSSKGSAGNHACTVKLIITQAFTPSNCVQKPGQNIEMKLNGDSIQGTMSENALEKYYDVVYLLCLLSFHRNI